MRINPTIVNNGLILCDNEGLLNKWKSGISCLPQDFYFFRVANVGLSDRNKQADRCDGNRMVVYLVLRRKKS